MRLPHLHLLAVSLSVAAQGHGASLDPDRVETLFRPPLAEFIALSPDGQRVAYTVPRGSELSLVIMNIEPPGPRRPVRITPERDALSTEELPPAHLRLLRWATGSRLVFGPEERVIPLPPIVDKAGRSTPNPDGPTIISPILLVDVDGKERGTLVDAKEFQETPDSARRTLADLLRTPQQLAATHNEAVRWRMPHLDVIGFLPRDREQMVIQTHGAYSKPSQHLVDLRTGDIKEFGGNWPSPPGEPQVFDGYRLKVVGEHKDGVRPTTLWRDDELAGVQRELEKKFPRRGVEILDWSETRARVLFRVTGGSDAGRFFVLQRPEDVVLEILQRAPWLPAAKLNETRFFECKAADGTPLTGYVTWPTNRATNPPPLLLVFPSGFPGRAHSAFDPETQVLADLGFVVARLNHRSVAGIAAKDLTALRAAVDRVAVDDARSVIDWLATRDPNRTFDRQRVAAFGRGFGGYLAVRALELQPDTFRGGIAIDAPMDLRSWLRPPTATGAAPAPGPNDIPVALIDHPGTDWKKLSVIDQVDTLTSAVLLLAEPGRSKTVDAGRSDLRTRLSALGRPCETIDLEAGFAAGKPVARANAYRKIEDFLNQHLNGYGAAIGAAKSAP